MAKEKEEKKTEAKEAKAEKVEASNLAKQDEDKSMSEVASGTAEDKKAKLLARAKKLAGEVKEEKGEVALKEKIVAEKEAAKDTLVPIEDYLKSSIYLGTRVVTPDMRSYVYRRRADGLAVFNTALLDKKIRESADYLAKYDAKDFILVCKREAGWKAAKKFAEIIGVRVFTKKYPAGILTNTNLSNFFETNMVFICDPWLDKNALMDANRIKVPVMSICDTNNYTAGVTQIVPGNNKSGKSIGIILYLLAKLYVEKKGLKVPAVMIQDFVDDWDNLQAPQ